MVFVSIVVLCAVGAVLSADTQAPQSALFVNSHKKIESDSNATVVTKTGNATEERNSTLGPKSTPDPSESIMPESGAQKQEHETSMHIFFILFIIVISIILVHLLIVNHIHFIPESLAIVILGAVIGVVVKWSKYAAALANAEAFNASTFFLVLLPPIIFESGYNLHKGNFFANLGSILVFAIAGTILSSIAVGGGIWVLGQADLIYELSAVQSFAFGAMISAVDPVATLAIFQALDVDPLLYMLVFGESMLNDAVAIVLTTTVLELNTKEMAELSTAGKLVASCVRFVVVFFGSALIGALAGMLSALLLKHVDLRRTPSLEFALMLVLAYLPYGLAEGLHLSGIMAILFCGICMSHYTHYNLSPITQITMQQTFRTLAFVCETCVFAYLGLALFTFPLQFEWVFIVWGIVLILIGRALNIFPLAYACNLFREHKITRKMQFVMWFSGLRGAIAFALSLFMENDDEQERRVIVASTLAIVLFTTMVLGGATMPLLSFLDRWFSEEPKPPVVTGSGAERRRRRRTRRERARRASGAHRQRASVTLVKSHEMSVVVDTTGTYSDYTTEQDEQSAAGPSHSQTASANRPPSTNSPAAFLVSASSAINRFDAHYLRPLLVRKFTQKEKKESTRNLTDMALKWYEAAQQETDDSDCDDVDVLVQTDLLRTTPTTSNTDVNIHTQTHSPSLHPLTLHNHNGSLDATHVADDRTLLGDL